MFPDIATSEPSNWNPTIVGALIALVSGLLGATIGAWTNFLLAKHKEKSDFATEQRKNKFETKRAARLIYMDYLNAWGFLDGQIQAVKWSPLNCEASAWKLYSQVLAPAVSDEDWHILYMAEISIRHVLFSRTIAEKNGLIDDSISAKSLEVMKSDSTRISAALDVLKKISRNF